MDIVLRAATAFVFVFLLLRLMGRRELSTLEPFDVILLVVIGDLVQQGVTQSDMSLTGTILAVGTFGLLVIVTSYLSFRFKAARKVLESTPIVILQHGNAIERNLRSERLTLDEVASAARVQQIASLAEVEWAIVEPSGQISFIPKPSDG
jgi:uncharacterized membrane protein YcaP (DUF421 family)